MNEKKLLITSILLTISIFSFGQNMDSVEGKVSFITSKNIYVKFDNTEKIAIGDTLYIDNSEILSACLLVNQKSSSSTICTLLENCNIEKGTQVYYKLRTEKKLIKEKLKKIEKEISKPTTPIAKKSPKAPSFRQRIKARISASTNSNKNSDDDWNHRLNYRFSLDANHVNNSKFSVESYLNYRQRILPKGTTSSYATKIFRVYNLALNYDVDSSLSILLGRKINYRASSLGAIDGLQVEKRIGKIFTGLILGFRPDIFDYSINTHLLQYGAYVGSSIKSDKIYAQTTLGLLEQRNFGLIDRRYTFLQHSSNIGRKLNIFGSLELDLYKKINGIKSFDTRLTNLFLSVRYKFSRRINLNVSYDSRKRIIHYETFKTDVEKILELDEARQGLRARLNVRPFKRVNTGISFSKRFQNSNQNESTNLNGFISWSRIPYIKGRFSVNYNYNVSSYLQSNIWSFRHARSMLKRKINLDLYFRIVNYVYLSNEIKRTTKYYGANFSFRLTRKLRLSILGEFSDRTNGEGYRFNTKLIQRFDRKNK